MKTRILFASSVWLQCLWTGGSRFVLALVLGSLLAPPAWGNVKHDDDEDDQDEDHDRVEKREGAPTASSPIAITSDDRFVWVVNPDKNSVSVIEVGGDLNRKIGEITVGEDPRCVAIAPKNRRVFVTNQRSGTVSVIDAETFVVLKTIKVGTEPVGCALTPDGKRLYVANFSSDSVSVINAHSGHVIKTIKHVGPKPRAIAIQGNKVFVTHFLAQLRNDGRPVVEKEGRDNGKDGRVTVIAVKEDEEDDDDDDNDDEGNGIRGTVVLNPLTDTGFRANGSVLDGIPATNSVASSLTGAFPNLLESIVIKGNRGYLPNVGSSPNGPVRFDVNVQGLLSVFNIRTGQDSEQTINMNQGVQFENPGQRLFNTTPIAIAFKRNTDEGFAVLAGVDRLVRVELDANGQPTISAPTSLLPLNTTSSIVRIAVGQNPQGIVINSLDTRAYVMNFISRDVSVVDIGGPPASYHEFQHIQSTTLPTPGTLEAIVHRGNELFNTSIGPTGTVANALTPAGRLSAFGWGNCYNCHPRGLTDGVTWMFGDGPRQTISMESTAEHPQPSGPLHINTNGAPLLPDFKQRVLNWSAVRDEIQDFELNIRAVSGGQGLIRDGLAVVNLTPTTTTGRDADLDAIAAYIALGIKAPISPRRHQNVSVGGALFARANCQICHGGPNWTRSRVDFPPPPPAAEITANQLTRFLTNVMTFDAAATNEFRPFMVTNIVTANGVLGFNIPSLLSVFAGAPYLHSGAAQTLGEVLDNVAHRSVGTGGIDMLSNRHDRAALVRFLESIDEATAPFP